MQLEQIEIAIAKGNGLKNKEAQTEEIEFY
jgi:hypothetical protein